MKSLGGFSGFLLCIVFGNAVVGSPEGDKQNVKQCEPPMECAPVHLCSDNGTIIKDGRSIIDLRSLSFSPKNNNGCHWTQRCCSDADKKAKVVEQYVSRGCGYSNPNGLEVTLKNAGKGESQFGEFPWMVGVWENHCLNGKCNYTAQGGGSLLAPNVVLTTAHKIYKSSAVDLKVRAGEWDTLTMTEPYAHEDRVVATKIIHPNFDENTGFYDVALLILKTPFKLSAHIDTICLPGKFDSFTQSRCIVMGWGRKQIDDVDYPNLLKKIDVPFVDRSRCQNQLRRTRLGRYFELHNSFVCAGGEKDKDACFGDGGSPLVCPSPFGTNRYKLAGIVSWGLECGFEDVPGVYANVQMLRPWIEAQFREYHISTANI